MVERAVCPDKVDWRNDSFVKDSTLAHWSPKEIIPLISPPLGAVDDVKLDHYQSPPLIFMGSQRKGVKDPFPNASSYLSHMEQATSSPFPLGAPCPLPTDVDKAVKFLKRLDKSGIEEFWADQMQLIKKMSAHPYCSSANWYSARPLFLRKAPTTLNVAIIAQLADFYGIGARNWLSQYISGFPISGTICQSMTFPLTETPDNPFPTSIDSLLAESPAKFKTRSARKPPHAEALWLEATEQVAKGWLAAPRILNREGRFADAPNFPLINAFRFAVLQNEKIRACDDLLASGTNSSCSVLSPITLPSWEHVAHIAAELALSGHDIAFGKGDESDAYKKQPMKPPDAFLAVITLQGPDGRRYGFVPCSQLFGSVASVVHYNTFSRLFISLFVRIFGIPGIAYFDDYGFLIFAHLQDAAFNHFRQFCDLMGVELSPKKCSISNINTFLGLRGFFPSRANSFRLSVMLGELKAEKWIAHLQGIIREGRVDHKTLDRLVGRLSFAQTNVFGKFARPLSQELYDKLHANPFDSSCDSHFLSNLSWWLAALKSGISRTISVIPKYPKFIIYTDASWSDKKKSGRIAAILIEQKSRKVLEVLSSAAPISLVNSFKNSSAIYGLELFALVAATAAWQQLLAHSYVCAYVDNDPSSNGLIRGAAKFEIAHNMILRYWQLAHKRSICVWFERAPSPRNLADLPTRNRSLPIPALKWREFPAVEFLVAHFTKKWSFSNDSSLGEYGRFK